MVAHLSYIFETLGSSWGAYSVKSHLDRHSSLRNDLDHTLWSAWSTRILFCFCLHDFCCIRRLFCTNIQKISSSSGDCIRILTHTSPHFEYTRSSLLCRHLGGRKACRISFSWKSFGWDPSRCRCIASSFWDSHRMALKYYWCPGWLSEESPAPQWTYRIHLIP